MQLGTYKLTEKKSKFLAALFKVETAQELQTTIEDFKKSHAKAAHVCYGYTLNGEEVFKNDGEVGHPGRALLDILKDKKKTNHLLIVARYYGGIKLGPGGVRRAFRDAGRACFEE